MHCYNVTAAVRRNPILIDVTGCQVEQPLMKWLRYSGMVSKILKLDGSDTEESRKVLERRDKKRKKIQQLHHEKRVRHAAVNSVDEDNSPSLSFQDSTDSSSGASYCY